MTTPNDTSTEETPPETPTAATAVERAKARGHAVPDLSPAAVSIGADPSPEGGRPAHWTETARYAQPQHYGLGAFEVADVIEAYAERTQMRPAAAWHVGQAIRYLLRSGRKKGDDATRHVSDLRKARWHLDRAILRIIAEPYGGDYR